MTRPATLARVGLLALLVADGALVGYRAWLVRQIARWPVASIAFEPGAVVPEGYLVNGLRYEPLDARARCFVIRYVAANCPYCSAEIGAWNSVAAHARREGCDVVGVVPEATVAMAPSSYGSAAARQLAFVTMDWVRLAPPRYTPTLVVYARGASEAWCRVGQLTAEGAREADAQIEDAAGRGARPRAPRQRRKREEPVKCS